MSIKNYKTSSPFELESGDQLPEVNVAYHTFGTLNESASNVVWVFHALSANSNVLEWWPGLFGQKNYFNPEKHFIVCANVLGSPYGTISPKDLDFPQFTVRDVVKLHLRLAEHLKIERISVAIGGSFGGAQALEFAYLYSGKIDRMVLLACSAKESAWGIAIHESQRIALESDPTFGEPEGGKVGMKAARSAALLTYRTSEAFIATQTDVDEKTDNYSASSYMQYQGEKFVKRFNALSYYFLSKCLDSHNIGRNRGGEEKALSRIEIPTLVIGIKTDALVPIALQKSLTQNLPNGIYKEIDSEYGHDGFLVETVKTSKLLEQFLEGQNHIGMDKSMNFINVFAFGKGTVGGRFLDQLKYTSEKTEQERGLNSPKEIISQLRRSNLKNIAVVDNTSSEQITASYPLFAKAGFDIVASNKKANSASFDFYQELRESLNKSNKQFHYETNVGAGLPIIDTLRQLYHSADQVKQVRGVLSGSLSYIFNRFSEEDVCFSEVMLEAKNQGYTEPDPREDLNGLDVARKLLILARELGSSVELEEVEVENLVPEALQGITDVNQFLECQQEIDAYYSIKKNELMLDHVFRYVGELNVERNSLKVSLEQFPKVSPMGSVKNADAIFEIYTETYGDQPIVIQGAGAGAKVTARGVYSDLLRLNRN